jgi:hypothetical protein
MSHPGRVKSEEVLNLPVVDAHTHLRIPVIKQQEQNGTGGNSRGGGENSEEAN